MLSSFESRMHNTVHTRTVRTHLFAFVIGLLLRGVPMSQRKGRQLPSNSKFLGLLLHVFRCTFFSYLRPSKVISCIVFLLLRLRTQDAS